MKFSVFNSSFILKFKDASVLLGVCILLGVSACTNPKVEKQAVTTMPALQPAPPPRDIRGENIQRLLSAAEDALLENRLTTPVEDNAFDRYQAVLMMDANNERAQAGIDAIVEKYAGLSRSAMRRGNYSDARAFIEKARTVDSSSNVIPRLRNELAAAQRTVKPPVKAPVQTVTRTDSEVLLDAKSLSGRGDEIVDQLQSLAVELREKDESILIFARNDAEGRWIYKKMAEAVIGYRLRGDMRISQQPKIQILPPIE